MSSRIPRGRGGRKGQQHRASPGDLRSYEVTPASEVTVTRADGTVEKQPAIAPKRTAPKPRRPKKRGPAVCAMCGEPIKGAVVVSRQVGLSKGKPVDEACEAKAKAFTQGRIAEKRARKAAAGEPPRPRLSVAEENRQLLAAQDRIRQLQRERAGQAVRKKGSP